VLGAVSLTEFRAGPTATQVRVGSSTFFFLLVIGVLGWLGLYRRDARLRALIPLRS
jgi:hypothetical protein